MFKSNIRMWTKFDLSDFHCGMIVGAKMAGWSVSETVNVLGFSSTMVSGVYLKWCIKRKTSSEQQFCGQKHFVDDRVQRRRPDWFELYNREGRKASQKSQHVKPWGRWIVTAGDHVWFYTCHPGTKIFSCSGKRFNKTGQLKTGNSQPGLMDRNFCQGSRWSGQNLMSTA